MISVTCEARETTPSSSLPTSLARIVRVTNFVFVVDVDVVVFFIVVIVIVVVINVFLLGEGRATRNEPKDVKWEKPDL